MRNCSNTHYHDEDWSGRDLRNTDFSESTFENMNLDGADLTGCCLRNIVFKKTTMCGATLHDVDLRYSVLYETDMTGAHIEGANVNGTMFNDTILDGVTHNDKTKFFKMRCPETGAFIGYKKCQDDRIAMLLIPADAKRSSATFNTCRCSKAKVLTIRSIDRKWTFTEATATITDDFVYRKGQWAIAHDFDENRWHDAAPGLHFWMSWDEAINY